MSDKEKIVCPICGTKNDQAAETCKMCKTRLAKKADGSLSVKSPKSRGKTHIMIDIEDPLTRKKLEELTLIPGINRKKALMLFQSGIHSMEDFLAKALHGERFSVNYSRTVANKLLVQSLKGKKKGKNAEIFCPSCNAPNPIDGKKCKVCNFDIKSDMESVDMESLSGELTDSVKEILTTLSESEDFKSLPEELKTQFAALVGSEEIDFDMQKPKEMDSVDAELDMLDPEPEAPKAEEKIEAHEDAADPDATAQEDAEEGAETPDGAAQEDGEKVTGPQSAAAPTDDEEKAELKDAGQEPAPEPEKAQPSTPTNKQEKLRKILEDKMVKWRKSGYDVAPLEGFLDDVEDFKAKAKEVLGNGKVVKQRCEKQLQMWKEKGFDVSELEPMLETDIDMFQEKAKEILKKQKI